MSANPAAEGGQKAAEKRAKYPRDNVAEEAEPVTECNTTG